METQIDRGQCQKAARVKVEPEPSPRPECVPIKEEPVDQQNSDSLTEAQTEEKTEYRIVVKKEPSCFEGRASPGVSTTADLYKDHTIKDELVIGPELLHCSTVTPVFYVVGPIKEEPVDQQNTDCLTEAQIEEKTEYRIVVKEEGGPALPGVRATAGLYKDHTIKDELVIGPELLHCSIVNPVFYGHVVSSETGAALENSDLDRHKKIDTATPLNCNLEDLQTHKSTHSDDKPFHCNYCDYKSNRNDSVKIHENRHTGTKPFQCDYCDYKCVQKVSLRMHTMTHTGEKPFQCSYCDYKCARKVTLQRHTMTHSGEKPFQCRYCDYKCIRKPTLRDHETKHTGEKLFQCDKCDYNSSKKYQLTRHELNHINPFQCPFCDFKCSQIAQLRKHESTHNGHNRYKCKDCNFRCRRIAKLRKHELIHTSKKRPQCDYCEYTCDRYSVLLKHERTHTSEKPLQVY